MQNIETVRIVGILLVAGIRLMHDIIVLTGVEDKAMVTLTADDTLLLKENVAQLTPGGDSL